MIRVSTQKLLQDKIWNNTTDQMWGFRILERILFEKIREAKYPDTYDFLLEGNYLTDQEFCKHIKQKQSQMGQLVRYLLLSESPLFIKKGAWSNDILQEHQECHIILKDS